MKKLEKLKGASSANEEASVWSNWAKAVRGARIRNFGERETMAMVVGFCAGLGFKWEEGREKWSRECGASTRVLCSSQWSLTGSGHDGRWAGDSVHAAVLSARGNGDGALRLGDED